MSGSAHVGPPGNGPVFLVMCMCVCSYVVCIAVWSSTPIWNIRLLVSGKVPDTVLGFSVDVSLFVLYFSLNTTPKTMGPFTPYVAFWGCSVLPGAARLITLRILDLGQLFGTNCRLKNRLCSLLLSNFWDTCALSFFLFLMIAVWELLVFSRFF